MNFKAQIIKIYDQIIAISLGHPLHGETEHGHDTAHTQDYPGNFVESVPFGECVNINIHIL